MFNKFQTDTPEAAELGTRPIDNTASVVLLKMMFHMNRVNMVKGSPKQLMEKMGVTLWDFNTGVRALKTLDYIRKFTKWEYMVNPNIIFNGDERQYFVVQHMWDTETTKGAQS